MLEGKRKSFNYLFTQALDRDVKHTDLQDAPLYQDVLLSRHMLPLYSPYVLGFFKNKFGGAESFAPLQAAYMRNIWKSKRG